MQAEGDPSMPDEGSHLTITSAGARIRSDLRDALRSAARANPDASPVVLVEEVSKRIPEEKLRSVLEELLIPLARGSIVPTHRPGITFHGTPLSAGHQHARALRLVAKAILRDIWLEGRRLTDEAKP